MSDSGNLVLNIGRIVKRSKVNGPGKRFTIWLQGCSLRCKGCINERFWTKEPNQLITVSDLFSMILNTPDIEGVTYTGGEPFEQAEGLYHLSVLLKDKGLSILSYSGFTHEEIINSNNRFHKLFLSTLCILIDGRYERNKAAPLLWRGSRNQKIYFLTDRYKDYEQKVNDYKLEMEFSLEPETNRISIEGNFSQEILEEIQKRMGLYGIKIG